MLQFDDGYEVPDGTDLATLHLTIWLKQFQPVPYANRKFTVVQLAECISHELGFTVTREAIVSVANDIGLDVVADGANSADWYTNLPDVAFRAYAHQRRMQRYRKPTIPG